MNISLNQVSILLGIWNQKSLWHTVRQEQCLLFIKNNTCIVFISRLSDSSTNSHGNYEYVMLAYTKEYSVCGCKFVAIRGWDRIKGHGLKRRLGSVGITNYELEPVTSHKLLFGPYNDIVSLVQQIVVDTPTVDDLYVLPSDAKNVYHPTKFIEFLQTACYSDDILANIINPYYFVKRPETILSYKTILNSIPDEIPICNRHRLSRCTAILERLVHINNLQALLINDCIVQTSDILVEELEKEIQNRLRVTLVQQKYIETITRDFFTTDAGNHRHDHVEQEHILGKRGAEQTVTEPVKKKCVEDRLPPEQYPVTYHEEDTLCEPPSLYDTIFDETDDSLNNYEIMACSLSDNDSFSYLCE